MFKNTRDTTAIMISLTLVSACNPGKDESAVGSLPAASASCQSVSGNILTIPAGETLLGSNSGYPEERPVREASVEGFTMDATEVTNAQFSAFVDATDYVTSSERVQTGFGVAGSAVFVPPDVNNTGWWRFVGGANWRHPEGPESTIEGEENAPVVQVSYADAKAYADWAGRALPTEEQWEYAAKGGGTSRFTWGDTRSIDGVEQANTWQGAFPIENTNDDGYLRRAPVGCFPPNNFGLHDMIGNVWEWTDSIYKQSAEEPSYVIKGGSFLCAESYCRRYRASARQAQEAGFPTNHIGFRTVSK